MGFGTTKGFKRELGYIVKSSRKLVTDCCDVLVTVESCSQCDESASTHKNPSGCVFQLNCMGRECWRLE